MQWYKMKKCVNLNNVQLHKWAIPSVFIGIHTDEWFYVSERFLLWFKKVMILFGRVTADKEH